MVLDGFEAFVEATIAQACLGIAGRGWAIAGRPGERVRATGAATAGEGGVTDWRMFRSDSFSNSPTCAVMVATFSTRARSSWYLVGGGGEHLEALSRFLIRRRWLMTSCNSGSQRFSSPMTLISDPSRASMALSGGTRGGFKVMGGL